MSSLPKIDVNILVYNGAETVGAAIESVLIQSWPNMQISVFDDGSTDGTGEILRDVSARHPNIRLMTARRNCGAVAAFQRAFWEGNSDFVMPKSGDDLIAPDFVEKVMGIMLDYPQCAMCHAAGLIFSEETHIRGLYPLSHCLQAVDPDPLQRARHVMTRYTSSPSFWGVFRRDATDQLARIRYRAGWDHALLAELALYGEIRHIAQPLYWRRDGGKPISYLARASTERGSRGLAVDGALTEPHWRLPLSTTALAHLEVFAVARITEAQREEAFKSVVDVFRARWLALLRGEADLLRQTIAGLLGKAEEQSRLYSGWILRQLADLLHVVGLLLPEEDFSDVWQLVSPKWSRQSDIRGAA